MTGYDVTIFGIHLTLKPVAFSIPIGSKSWDIYWYGIIIAVGFLLALVYAMKNAKRFGVDTDRMLDVVLVSTPVAILCARAYYVIFDGEKLTSLADFFGFGESSGFAGLAIYGGVIGAFGSGVIMCRIRKVSMLDLFDLGATGFLIGQGVGRWGNFVNQEAYGSFTGSSWWGMESTRTINEMGEGMVHPCFLYESIWCIAGFFILNKLGKKRRFKGEILLMYCVWYGFGRGIIEILRTDSLMIGSVKVSCLLSFLICAAAIVIIGLMRKRTAEKAVASDYDPVFMDKAEFEKMESGEELDAAEDGVETAEAAETVESPEADTQDITEEENDAD